MRLPRLSRFGRDWNSLGRRNPYGAILTGESGALSIWDAEAFFATGRADVARFVGDLTRIAPHVKRGRALDFGCGVGRITRSLGTEFNVVVGVDVAPTMIERARVVNAGFPQCEFVLNREPHLAGLASGSFDVVYSRLVLQHISMSLVRGYLPELIRVLAPDGVLMFQLPESIEPPLKRFLDAPVVGGTLKHRVPRPLTRAYRRLKYLYLIATSGPRMKMSGLPFGEVARLIARSGGLLLAAVPDESHGIPTVRGFEYWVTKPR
jgi:SAM-dependent methyltransferase